MEKAVSGGAMDGRDRGSRWVRWVVGWGVGGWGRKKGGQGWKMEISKDELENVNSDKWK